MARQAAHANSNGRISIDSRVTINIVIAAVVISYAVAMAWWASGIDTNVRDLRARYEAAASNGDRLTRVEESVKNLQTKIDDKSNSLKDQFEQGINDIKRLVTAQWPAVVQSVGGLPRPKPPRQP